MLEWCYQWDDYDEVVERHYKNLSKMTKSPIEKTGKQLVQDLQQQAWVLRVEGDKHRYYQKKPDAKDGIYREG